MTYKPINYYMLMDTKDVFLPLLLQGMVAVQIASAQRSKRARTASVSTLA